jgi:hypothetical protein
MPWSQIFLDPVISAWKNISGLTDRVWKAVVFERLEGIAVDLAHPEFQYLLSNHQRARLGGRQVHQQIRVFLECAPVVRQKIASSELLWRVLLQS